MGLHYFIDGQRAFTKLYRWLFSELYGGLTAGVTTNIFEASKLAIFFHAVHRVLYMSIVVTYESIRARAVVAGHAVDAGAPVLAGARPALVPVGLTLHARVPVDTVTGIRAANTDINLRIWPSKRFT